jgi:hypothetical protein
MLYQRIDRYTDLSYESYNIYIYTPYTIYYISEERRAPRGEKGHPPHSPPLGSKKPLAACCQKRVAAACFVEGIRRTTTVPAVGTAPLSYFAAPRGFAAKKAE